MFNTVSDTDVAVALVLKTTNRTILLADSADDRYNGKLIFPGGHIHVNEDVFSGGCREVFEETGIIIKPIEKVIYEVLHGDVRVSFFIGIYVDGEINVDTNELKSAKWYDYTSPDYMNNLYDEDVKVLQLVYDQLIK